MIDSRRYLVIRWHTNKNNNWHSTKTPVEDLTFLAYGSVQCMSFFSTIYSTNANDMIDIIS